MQVFAWKEAHLTQIRFCKSQQCCVARGSDKIMNSLKPHAALSDFLHCEQRRDQLYTANACLCTHYRICQREEGGGVNAWAHDFSFCADLHADLNLINVSVKAVFVLNAQQQQHQTHYTRYIFIYISHIHNVRAQSISNAVLWEI